MNVISIIAFAIAMLASTTAVYAHCPLCAVATGSVVAVARMYGVDDLIVGTLLGGFLISTSAWLNNMLLKWNKKKEYIPFQFYIVTLASLVLTIVPMAATNLFVDRIFSGIIIGSIATLFAFYLHKSLRQINNNRNYMPFQVIILTLMALALTNASFYLVGLI